MFRDELFDFLTRGHLGAEHEPAHGAIREIRRGNDRFPGVLGIVSQLVNPRVDLQQGFGNVVSDGEFHAHGATGVIAPGTHADHALHVLELLLQLLDDLVFHLVRAGARPADRHRNGRNAHFGRQLHRHLPQRDRAEQHDDDHAGGDFHRIADTEVNQSGIAFLFSDPSRDRGSVVWLAEFSRTVLIDKLPSCCSCQCRGMARFRSRLGHSGHASDQLFFLGTRHAFDFEFTLQRHAAAFLFFLIDQHDGQAPARVARGGARIVLLESPFHVVGDPSVKGSVHTAYDIDRPECCGILRGWGHGCSFLPFHRGNPVLPAHRFGDSRDQTPKAAASDLRQPDTGTPIVAAGWNQARCAEGPARNDIACVIIVPISSGRICNVMCGHEVACGREALHPAVSHGRIEGNGRTGAVAAVRR